MGKKFLKLSRFLDSLDIFDGLDILDNPDIFDSLVIFDNLDIFTHKKETFWEIIIVDGFFSHYNQKEITDL